MDTERLTITYEVLSVERCNAGRLIGMATVKVDICGVEMTIAGFQVRRTEPGHVDIVSPTYRHPSGEWRGVVELPPAVWDAIAGEVATVATGRAALLVT